MNDWNEKLEYSLSAQQHFDMEILQQHIPGCVSIRKTDIAQDKKGVDYVATLKGGAEVLIDAKTRTPGSKRYWKNGEAELALETWSVVGQKKGWTLSDSSDVDYILYTFDSQEWNKFYLIPFQMLRKAFIENGKEWCNKYGRKTQYSNSWSSECVFVPASDVLEAVSECMSGEKYDYHRLFDNWNWKDDSPIKELLLMQGYGIKDNKLYYMGAFVKIID